MSPKLPTGRKPTRNFCIRLPDEMRKAVEAEAIRRNVNDADVVRECIEKAEFMQKAKGA